MIYQTQIRTVSKGVIVDASGRYLKCVANYPVHEGDKVYTDGQYIFGHTPIRGGAAIQEENAIGAPLYLYDECNQGYFDFSKRMVVVRGGNKINQNDSITTGITGKTSRPQEEKYYDDINLLRFSSYIKKDEFEQPFNSYDAVACYEGSFMGNVLTFASGASNGQPIAKKDRSGFFGFTSCVVNFSSSYFSGRKNQFKRDICNRLNLNFETAKLQNYRADFDKPRVLEGSAGKNISTDIYSCICTESAEVGGHTVKLETLVDFSDTWQDGQVLGHEEHGTEISFTVNGKTNISLYPNQVLQVLQGAQHSYKSNRKGGIFWRDLCGGIYDENKKKLFQVPGVTNEVVAFCMIDENTETYLAAVPATNAADYSKGNLCHYVHNGKIKQSFWCYNKRLWAWRNIKTTYKPFDAG
jgi:hypothetical protein